MSLSVCLSNYNMGSNTFCNNSDQQILAAQQLQTYTKRKLSIILQISKWWLVKWLFLFNLDDLQPSAVQIWQRLHGYHATVKNHAAYWNTPLKIHLYTFLRGDEHDFQLPRINHLQGSPISIVKFWVPSLRFHLPTRLGSVFPLLLPGGIGMKFCDEKRWNFHFSTCQFVYMNIYGCFQK